MDLETNEFHDWEVLQNSDESGLVDRRHSVEKNRDLEGIEGVSDVMVQTDYFSLDSHWKYTKNTPEGDVSEGSVEFDNPSSIDPVPETQYPRKVSSLFWSDSSSDPSNDGKFGEFDAKNDSCFTANEKSQVDFERLGEIGIESENPGKLWSDSSGIESISMELHTGGMNMEVGFCVSENSRGGPELPGEENELQCVAVGSDQAAQDDNVVTKIVKSPCGEGKKGVVWWMLPLEFLKYCVFRVSPVWTFSLPAAVVSFAILGRRLYKMRRKSRSLSLKVTVDDKKVSQFMGRAAHLNEAFSVVRWVPITRPSLPAAGLAQWPIMSLR